MVNAETSADELVSFVDSKLRSDAVGDGGAGCDAALEPPKSDAKGLASL